VFGLTFDKLALIAILAVVILGPERLPHYAQRLAELVRTLRALADSAKTRLKEEMGPEVDDIDWKKLDPRQYDPRRIIREALLDDEADAQPAVQPAVQPPVQPPLKAGSDGRYRRPLPAPEPAPAPDRATDSLAA
jgi:sec-independent protein translocase protein TatB